MKERTINPIAKIKTDFTDKFGIPRQSGRVSWLKGTIIFEKEFRKKEALKGLENFSHLWILFDFSKSHQKEFSPTVRPPRLGGNKRVGVFASRSPFRPNSIGLSSVKILDIADTEDYGTVIHVGGVDILDGSDIYDIKPYLPSSDCHLDAIGGFADDFTNYKLKVEVPKTISDNFDANFINLLIDVIKEDPRPSYQNDPLRVYKMKIKNLDVSFTVNNGTAFITDISKI